MPNNSKWRSKYHKQDRQQVIRHIQLQRLDMAYFLLICGSDFLFRAAYGFDGPKCDIGLFRRWNSKKPQGCGCRRAIGTEILLNTVEKRFLGRVCCNFSRCRTDLLIFLWTYDIIYNNLYRTDDLNKKWAIMWRIILRSSGTPKKSS